MNANVRIAEAQERNAALYRSYERRAPWNSKTRQGWRELAEEAEACADHHRKVADERERVRQIGLAMGITP